MYWNKHLLLSRLVSKRSDSRQLLIQWCPCFASWNSAIASMMIALGFGSRENQLSVGGLVAYEVA